ncbi:MAG: GNAT family N-acetyltransferase [Lachnospiraceae bacterium]|nr:GNAT family N-acetyltransferase [Lachnospiraceae bacterium]
MIEISLFDRNNIQYVNEAAHLLADNFPHAYKDCALEEMEEYLASEKIAMMATDGGHFIGFVGAVPHYDGNVWELHPLVVERARQCQGIGTKLMELAISRIKEMNISMISVIYGEEKLRSFYEKFGFFTMLCGQMEVK